MKREHFFRFLNAILALIALLFSPLNAEQLLTIDAAWERILTASPDLRQKWAEIWVQEGQTLQSSLSPNPSIEFDVSNVWGNKEYSSWKHADYSLGLAQVFETGGKRRRRAAAAGALRDVALRDAEILLLNIYHDLYQLLAKTALYQEKLAILQRKQMQSQKMFEFVSERHTSGKDTFLQQRIARSNSSLDFISVRKGLSDLQQHKILLAKLWGVSYADFEGVDFNIHKILPPPDLCHLIELTQSAPDYLRLQQLTWAAQEELALQQSRKYTDVATYAGFRQHHHPHRQDNAYNFFFGAAINLPFNDRNQGNILSASSGLTKAQFAAASGLVEIEATLRLAHQQWELAYDQALDLQKHVSELEETIALMQNSFNEGKLSYAELANTQTAWFEAQSNLIETLLEIHLRRADVERILGNFFATAPLTGFNRPFSQEV